MQKPLAPEIVELMQFLNAAPTAWHAVDLLKEDFARQGFEVLHEGDLWTLKPGGKYVVERNGSSLCAFITPLEHAGEALIAASHTDSPGFKLKPQAEYYRDHMSMVGVEVYGSPLLSSWLNRDLGIAGRIVYLDKKGNLKESLVKCSESPLVIPQLAIHLDRQVNENGLLLNKQEHLAAFAGLLNWEEESPYLEALLKKQTPFKTLLGTDLFLYPLEPPALIGLNQEMVAAYRLDSLCSVYAISKGLMQEGRPHPHQLKMAVFWDNEEIGSETAQGAGSPFFLQVLERITLALGMGREEFLRLLRRSVCLSVDLAHAVHPNYPERHEPRHLVKLGKGIAIKFNAQQRYATDARSSAVVAELCLKLNLPLQKFVSRNDMACGSTIGPIHASGTGIPTVDIGIPQLSMHSSREIIAWQDHLDMCRLLNGFFTNPSA